MRVELPVEAIPAWIDGNSLVLLKGPGLAQLWRLAYPGGNLSRITNDLSDYRGISLSADRNSLVTARTEVRGGLWISDGDGNHGAESGQPVAGQGSALGAIAWAGDRLLFTTIHPSIYALAPNGQAEELLKEASAPAVTSDGKTLVYVSRSAGSDATLWKAGIDGQNPVKLVGEGEHWWPQITPDDQNVIYNTTSNGIIQTWVAPLSGSGTPRLVSKLNTAIPKLSPDGKKLAFGSLEAGDHWFISVCDWPDCSEPRHVRAMETRYFTLEWTPDGRAIAYAAATPVSNIWVHPLDGSPEHQLTHFTDQRDLFQFAWSRDGKHLAVARASTSQDIVLLRGLRPKS
jgi:WD40 repeat protein